MPNSGSRWLRLRQVALVAEKLAPVEAELCQVLGVEVCYRDPGVGHFGLENALFPVGNQLLEVVAPVQEVAPTSGWSVTVPDWHSARVRLSYPGGQALLLYPSM